MFKLLLTVMLVLASFTPLVSADTDTAIAPPFTVKDAAGNTSVCQAGSLVWMCICSGPPGVRIAKR